MRLISSNYGIITSVLNKHVRSEHMADVQQDILVRAWSRFPSFKGAGKFSTWLHTISTRTCIDHLRKQERVKRNDKLYFLIFETSHLETHNRLESIFKMLTDNERELLVLYIYTRLSGEKVVAINKMPISSFYDKLNKIKHKIKTQCVNLL